MHEMFLISDKITIAYHYILYICLFQMFIIIYKVTVCIVARECLINITIIVVLND